MPERVKIKFTDSDSNSDIDSKLKAEPKTQVSSNKRKASEAFERKPGTVHQHGTTIPSKQRQKENRVAEVRVVNFRDDEDDNVHGDGDGDGDVRGAPQNRRDQNPRSRTNAQAEGVTGRLRQRSIDLLKIRQQLPIWKHADEIRNQVRHHDVLLLVGETGSGKSTQIPQLLLPLCLRKATAKDGAKVGGCIAITQPRRVAAISLARRVAEEMGTPLGSSSPASQVGYSVRFDSSISPSTRVKFVTDGMLLQELVRDPWLKEYSVVVVDEVHERGVNVDLVLGFLKKLIEGRNKNDGRGGVPLKVVVMSATADMERIQRFFDPEDAGVVKAAPPTNTGTCAKVAACHIKGRQYPVKIHYSPVPLSDVLDAAMERIIDIHAHTPLPGDILVFLPGQEAIDTLESMCGNYAQTLMAKSKERGAPKLPRLLILPLFAALPTALQQRVFEPTPPFTRKIILSTNIAETSVTVPGIRHVIDTGKRKARFFRPGLNLDTLLTKSISRSSANQRAGRAGREAMGNCYRLYTEKSFYELEADTEPEILRCDLSQLVLTLKAHGIDNILNFPLLTPPPTKALERALLHLLRLKALSRENGQITTLGLQMSSLPLPAGLARTLLASQLPQFDCLEDIIDIVSGLSVENIWLPIHNPKMMPKGLDIVSSLKESHKNGEIGGQPNGVDEEDEDRNPVAQARSTLYRREGDHLTLLAAIQAYVKENADRKEWCRRHGISHRAMTGSMDVRKQLRKLFLEGNMYKLDGDGRRGKRAGRGQDVNGRYRSGKEKDGKNSEEFQTEVGEKGGVLQDDETSKAMRILRTLLLGLSENIAHLSPTSDISNRNGDHRRGGSSNNAAQEEGKESTIWTGPYVTMTMASNGNSNSNSSNGGDSTRSTRKNLSIHPSSVLFDASFGAPSTATTVLGEGRIKRPRPAYIMFSEFVVTGSGGGGRNGGVGSRAYARNVSAIEGVWLDEIE